MRKPSGSWISRLLGRDGAPAAAGGANLDAWMREGYAHQQQGRLADAEAAYRRILAADSRYADAAFFLGVIAESTGRQDEALACYGDAVDSKPDQPEFLFALGNLNFRMRRFDEAATYLGRGIALSPDNHEVRNDLAIALTELWRWEEAISILEPVVASRPEFFAAHYNLGTAYRQLGRIEEAIACYRHALRLDPGHLNAHNCLVFTLNYSDRHSAAEIAAEHRAFGLRHARPAPLPPAEPGWPRRLRLGYLSPDFRKHVVATFMWPALAAHDRERFEIICFHTSTRSDEETARLRAAVARWSDCGDLSDEALAERIRAHRVDILVDLAGHTSGQRLGVLALKPAPVQITYLGYPNTTGLPTVDYRITDALADPPGSADELNVERLLRLRPPFLCYRPREHTPDPGVLPMSRNGFVTFGCLDRKSTRLNSSHIQKSRMPSSA